jgi:hypothetical protein
VFNLLQPEKPHSMTIMGEEGSAVIRVSTRGIDSCQ